MNSVDDGENGAKKPDGDDTAKAMLPEWARLPFDDFRQQVMEIGDVLDLACQGIAMLRGRPQALEALAQATALDNEGAQADDSESKPDYLDSLDAAKRQADLAQGEVDKNFPLLHSQAIISLWSSLEALIENFLAAWLENEPTARLIDPVRKLKISMWQYDEMNSGERNLYTVELLEREVNSPLNQGVARFESLLDVFGFGGGTTEDVRKDIFEMNHIRNVLVHRRGRADRRLVDACPWLELKVGEPIQVSHQQFGRYYISTTQYFFDVYNRVRAHYGASHLDPFKVAKPSE